MAKKGGQRKKVPATVAPRTHKLGCVLSDEEMRVIEAFLEKYHIENRSRWVRETLIAHIYEKLDTHYPTLFSEHEMRG